MADYPELSAESQAIWEANGAWWGGVMGDGNRWHRELIAPATERLLSIRAGERVLDLACGNGQFSRRMAELGAHVVACDVSASMLQCARSRGVNDIDYRRMDLANPSELAALGEAEFDAAVCTMALMDMAMIGPLLTAARRAVKGGGRMVFSVPHPCFNTNGTTMLAERDDYIGEGQVDYSVRVRQYKSVGPQKGIGIVGQPQPHYYFHRSLAELLGACFAAGWTLTGIEEPAFTGGLADGAVRWQNLPEIPPIIVARLG